MLSYALFQDLRDYILLGSLPINKVGQCLRNNNKRINKLKKK